MCLAHRNYAVISLLRGFFSSSGASVSSSVNEETHAQLTGPNELIFILLLYRGHWSVTVSMITISFPLHPGFFIRIWSSLRTSAGGQGLSVSAPLNSVAPPMLSRTPCQGPAPITLIIMLTFALAPRCNYLCIEQRPGREAGNRTAEVWHREKKQAVVSA